MHALRLGCRHLHRGGRTRTTRQSRDTFRGLSCRPFEQTDVVRVFELARRDVTQGGTANALASDVVQPENAIQPERKTLRAEDVALDDASSDGKWLRTHRLAARQAQTHHPCCLCVDGLHYAADIGLYSGSCQRTRPGSGG